MDKGHTIKMGAGSLAENTPNAPEFVCPLAQMFWISIEKGFIVHSQQVEVALSLVTHCKKPLHSFLLFVVSIL